MANTEWRTRLGDWRGGLSVLAYLVSLSANFLATSNWIVPIGLIAAGIAWNIFLFLPEIKRLRIIVPKGTVAQSAKWLYIYGFVGVAAVGVASAVAYLRYQHAPKMLTSQEFAEPYVNAKYFHIVELVDPKMAIIGRTFENDWIYGPAVIYLADSSDIQSSEFEGTYDQVFQPVEATHPVGIGVITVRDGKFRHCHFFNISFVATPDMIEKFRGTNNGPGTSNP